MERSAPQLDVIGKQFQNVRNMISASPRGGGKTSTLAQLPIEHIKTIAQILGQAREGVAEGLGRIGSQFVNTGMGEKGMGLGASEAAGNIAMGGRNVDIQNSWKSFFKNLATSAAQGAGQAAGAAIMGG